MVLVRRDSGRTINTEGTPQGVKVKTMKKFELQATRQKSYYGKARVEITNGKALLYSYNTLVCFIDERTNTFYRTWDGYSLTTSNHINDFRRLYGLHAINKKRWLELPVVSCNPLVDLVKDYNTNYTPVLNVGLSDIA